MKNVIAHGIIVLSKTACILLLLCASSLCAQDFSLSVAVTNELCPGNGSLQFSVQNGGSSVNYKVYLLPDTTTPISNNANSTVSGLQDGTYLVVATTTVNGSQATDEQEVTITDNTTPLLFADAFTFTPSFCNDGVITVVMDSGTPITYQLTGGPETTPPQASATFSGLPAGLYTIKAIDACGTAVVTSYNLPTTAPTIQLLPGSALPQLPDCTHITIMSYIMNTTAPVTAIQYPLNVQVIVHPPGGAPAQTFTSNVNGTPALATVLQDIPFYYGQNYYYDLIVTDTCGNVFSLPNTPVMGVFGVSASIPDLECGNKALQLTPVIYVPPLSITFTNAPAGFDPTINPSYPDSFMGPIAVFGTNDDPLIVGLYEYTVTDACGRTINGVFDFIQPDPIVPTIVAQNVDCEDNLGRILAEVPLRVIETATIMSGPPEFEAMHTTPYDVSAYIDAQGKLMVDGLPPGNYTIILIDECGDQYGPTPVVVPQYTVGQLNPVQRPDCEPGMGTIYIGSGITSVIITAAPAGSPLALPYNCAAHINSDEGEFTLDNLLPGTYTFEIHDACQTYSKTISLAGYATTVDNIDITPYCGSFDISLYHTTTGIAGLSFWLQREITPGIWGHPGTGSLYTGGTYTQVNAYLLTNNAVNNTLMYPQGHYRIIKTHRAFESGDIAKDKTCELQLDDFYFIDGVQILGVESLTCSGVSGDIHVDAVGVEPLTYTITEKDYLPFTIANGNNSDFLGLDSAVYKVEVTDTCGFNEVRYFNLAEIPSLVNAFTAPDLTLCDAGTDGIEAFDLFLADNEILNGQDPADVTLTYHTSYNDATLGADPLPTTFISAETTIYARVTYNNSPACYDISQFNLVLNESTELQMQDIWYVCQGSEITLVADAGYVHYTWSTGESGPEITVTEGGDYSVEAFNAQGCRSIKTVTVITTALPVIEQIDVEDWTEANNIISVITATSPDASLVNFEYSIDGIHYQDSNIFTDLEPGGYTVYVRDIYGCDIDSETTYLLSYPRFFTPNKDGINETWRIKFSSMAEPDLMVYIYDRYGKLITGFDTDSIGWDGTMNGYDLPSTDYWFIVRRQNGKEYRGHFSMLR